MRLPPFALPALLVLGGCPADDAPTDDTDDTDAGLTEFEAVEVVFATSCATFGCHEVARGDLNHDLNLSPGNAHANLVNVPSGEAEAMDRVEPGSLANSYLWHKVSNTIEEVPGGTGDAMPSPFGLQGADLEAIRTWIEAGAPE